MRRSLQSEGGFALLITVTLLAFIVVLLLGLSFYTRVETAVAGNTQRQAQARENALLALNVALGQLQRHAGADTRVTATAQNFGAIDGTRAYTGVWSSDPTVTESPTVPLTWLVSGNEFTQPDPNPDAPPGSIVAVPLAVTPAAPGNLTVELVGRNTTGTATRTGYVVAPLSDVTSTGIPGAPATSNTTIGRYAWWVGDQGVKAPVAVPDTSSAITFAPYDTAESRGRIRQQLALGAGAADATGAPVFEPRDGNNTNLVSGQKVAAANQIAFLRSPTNTQLGLARVQQNFHTWSPNNYAVLANTKLGGLRQDLSLAPALLGSAFAAWADYPAYMEKLVPDAPVTDAEGNTTTPVATAPPITPAYGEEPLRRRYVMTPPLAADGAIFSAAPVLSFFGMSFSVRESESNAPQMEVALRCVISLWNPYSSALVPESLKVEIVGLPEIAVEDSAGGDHELNLQRVMTGGDSTAPMRFALPWTAETDPVDANSWLPGRVYSWSATENTSEPADGNPMVFHHPDATPPGAGEGIVRAASIHHHTNPVGVPAPVTRSCRSLAPTTLRLRVLRAKDDMELATYEINAEGFGPTTPLEVTHKYVDFAIVRRLPQQDELPATVTEKWLTAAGRDPRTPAFPASGLIGGANGEDPGAYGGERITGFTVRDANRLLDRGGGSYSYNEDAPVFELPRTPILSLGQLQHLQLAAARPFAVGNSWGSAAELNGIRTAELFDRFYFSGLVAGVTPDTTTTGELILPSPLLKPLRKPDGTRVAIEDVRALMAPPTTTDPDGNVIPGAPASSHSSKFFLQGGAFNLNSTNTAAWAAVLRGVRFPAPQAFSYLDLSNATGTAEDAATAMVESADAQFFRFSQSAQETYKAEPGLAGENPEAPSPANTHLFRRGMRTLTAEQVGALANRIKELVDTKHAAEGPFRSVEEFLSPSSLFAVVDPEGTAGSARSLLEAAIADAGLNAEIAEFSSQWLTQGDIMTALGPVLFPRSDTFVIRTYGEAVNPATSATEGRAWCEAIVQRVPEYLESKDNADDTTGDYPETAPADLTSEVNKVHGRRFKVVSFRWLSRADI